MFYIKSKLANGKMVKTDITDENVFTCCPECGRELPVDISEIFSDGEGDLYSTNIICCACANKRRHIDGLTITADGLALLSDVLCKSGYTHTPSNSVSRRRVAAYARVSTDSEEQQTSYTAQVDYYTKYIKGKPEWEFISVYTDDGISAVNTKHREGFNRMVEDDS